MSLFADFDDVVRSMMQDFGGCTGGQPNATYHKLVDVGTYDTATGSTTPVVSDIPIQAILIDYILKKDGLQSAFGTLVQDGDKMLYVRPTEKIDQYRLALNPNATSDRVTFSNIIYKVVVIKEVNTSGTDSVLFEILIRR